MGDESPQISPDDSELSLGGSVINPGPVVFSHIPRPRGRIGVHGPQIFVLPKTSHGEAHPGIVEASPHMKQGVARPSPQRLKLGDEARDNRSW